MTAFTGDYCPETRDNLELLISKMKLRRALKKLNIPYQVMGDLKMMNTLTGFIDNHIFGTSSIRLMDFF